MNNLRGAIPGPRGHFLIGSLPEIQKARLAFILDLNKSYGDVVQLRLGSQKSVVVFHPDGVQHILQDNHTNYSKQTRAFEGLKPIIGNGLLVSNGDFWLRQRRLIQPAFHRQQINSFADLIVRETQFMLDGWQADIESEQKLNVQQEMMRLTLAIVTQALFGSKVTDPDGKVASDISLLLADNTYRFDHPYYPGLWLPTPRNRRFLNARKDLDQIIYGLISSRKATRSYRREHDNPEPPERQDLLALLMQAQDAETGQGMSDQQLRDEVMTLFLAGHETTAVALSWTMYLLSQHPEVEQRLRTELGEILNGQVPGLADLPRLVYTRQVIDESMRLFPPAWIFERKALKDDEICGYRIPAGTTVVISPYATHRHPQFWDNPEAFDPDRFSSKYTAGRPRYAYFPFGGGPRQCIGNNFALMEAPLILAAVLQRFQLKLAPGWQVEPEAVVTLRPKGGMWMKVNKDNPNAIWMQIRYNKL